MYATQRKRNIAQVLPGDVSPAKEGGLLTLRQRTPAKVEVDRFNRPGADHPGVRRLSWVEVESAAARLSKVTVANTPVSPRHEERKVIGSMPMLDTAVPGRQCALIDAEAGITAMNESPQIQSE